MISFWKIWARRWQVHHAKDHRGSRLIASLIWKRAGRFAGLHAIFASSLGNQDERAHLRTRASSPITYLNNSRGMITRWLDEGLMCGTMSGEQVLTWSRRNLSNRRNDVPLALWPFGDKKGSARIFGGGISANSANRKKKKWCRHQCLKLLFFLSCVQKKKGVLKTSRHAHT